MEYLFWLDGYENGVQEEWFREYQSNARIYLDEYPEQKELRENLFKINHDRKFVSKFLDMIIEQFPSFGENSSVFDGRGDYITISDSTDWEFSKEDFEVGFGAYVEGMPIKDYKKWSYENEWFKTDFFQKRFMERK